MYILCIAKNTVNWGWLSLDSKDTFESIIEQRPNCNYSSLFKAGTFSGFFCSIQPFYINHFSNCRKFGFKISNAIAPLHR